jgi:hypothetical protein
MTLERFTAMVDAYGATPERWPEAERAGALALLAQSSDARTLRDAAAALDTMLDRAPPATPDAELERRVLARTPRAKVAPLRPRRRTGLVAAVALAAAASLAVWLVRRPAQTPALDPAVVAELGEYDTPTDALASSADLDAAAGVPLFGCEDPDLDCNETDLTTSKPSAMRPHLPKETLA